MSRWLRLLDPRSPGVSVTLVALLATIPFLGKAFHVDDTLYLAVARQILVTPWDPFGAEILWEKTPESLFDADFNPPLWSYLLAGVIACTGEPTVTVREVGVNEQGTPVYQREEPSRLPELATHGLESVFMGAAIAALYMLSRRWVRWPLAATALIALSPAVLPGQNIMLEGPVLAFWLWCVWCHLRGVDTGSMLWVWLAGVLAALAVMTKYTSGLVILVVWLDCLRRQHWRGLWVAAIPVVAVLLWSLHNWFVYERLHVLVILSRSQTSGREVLGIRLFETWGRVFAVLRAVGAGTALAIPVLAVVARRRGFWVTMLLLVAALGIAWLGKSDMAVRLVERDGRTPDKIFPPTIAAHLLGFGLLGTVALAGLAISPRRVRSSGRGGLPGQDEEFFLTVWLVAVGAFAILATPFLAIRHLVPGLPPLTWLTLRCLDQTFDGRWQRAANLVLGITVLVSSLGGFLVAKADYDFAVWYRHLALDVASRTVEAGRDRDKTVWYTGHWGWAYYADRVGMKPYIPGHTHMGTGDFLLMPLVQTWQLPPQELYPFLRGLMPPIRPVPRQPVITGVPAIDRALHWSWSGIRSISNEVHFYGCGTMSVPWQFSRRPLDFFDVIEVRGDEE